MQVTNNKRNYNKSRVNPTIRLKVPASLLYKAAQANLRTPVIYYYALKSFQANGLFNRGELVKYLTEKKGKCRATIKKNLAKLIALGWVRKTKQGYQVASYNTVWDRLGFDVYADHLGLLYVPSNVDFETHVALEELKKNQFKQKKAIERELIIRTTKITRTDYLLSSRSALQKKRIAALKKDNVETLKRKEFNALRALEISYVETDNSLTCEGFAKLIGKASGASGFRIQQKLKAAGLVKIENRKVNLKTRMHKSHFLQSDKINSSFWLFKGIVFKQFPNKVTII